MPRKAFTLLEVMLVMAVIVVVAGLAYPSLEGMYGGFKLTAATDGVRAAWAEGRSHAINEGRPYRFAVLPGKGNYRLAPDSGDFWSGRGATSGGDDPANPPLVLEDALPSGVRIGVTGNTGQDGFGDSGDTAAPAGGVDPGAWTTVVTFLPDGTCRADAEMFFHCRGARSLSVRLRGLTGVVTIRPL